MYTVKIKSLEFKIYLSNESVDIITKSRVLIRQLCDLVYQPFSFHFHVQNIVLAEVANVCLVK